MVYRRRYFEPFVGTTETIGDVSITSDKIASKAVTTPKVADDAITTEQIASETIRSEDIGTGQVKTSDLASGAVTTAKISDGAVTTPKIAGTVALRPLTPAASTSEIADVAVTLAKLAANSVDATKIKAGVVGASELAGDAVETVKIKDAAVTGAKIDTDTIVQANIAANAVGGPEIKDGAIETEQLSADAVETVDIKDDAVTNPKLADDAVDTDEIVDLAVTNPKLADDAVSTVKILDGAVTEPKLEDDFLAKHYFGRQVFYDDFLGTVLDNRWTESGNAGGSAVITTRSNVLIITDTDVNDTWRINWNGKQGIYMGKFPKLFARITLGQTANIDVQVGFQKDAVNYAKFEYNFGATGTWSIRTSKGGVTRATDTLVVGTLNVVKLFIDVVSATEIKYYIDDVLVFTETDPQYIPSAVDVEPLLQVIADGAAPRSFKIDTVVLTADPE